MQGDGPTQRPDEEALPGWVGHPWVSRAIRVGALLAPLVCSFLVTRWIASNVTAQDVGVPKWVWFVGVFTAGALVLILVDQGARRFLPLAALFKLSLVFPDVAPSRFSMALRTGTTKQLERRIEEIRSRGLIDDETSSAQKMLEMVAALSTHDRLTRGHCERVRAYTDMIAEELGLPEEKQQRLRWAALLHDVGKLFVPFEVLNKVGKPDAREWELLKSHTWKGDELTQPLADWLGEYALTIRSHHERWDGNGYPDRLFGEEIPFGARIVAVADTFDVMTSKRSYKQPIPATEARAEIARCAGSQFDPTVARAFLNIGLGRLRMAIGPLSWLANVPASGQLPIGPAVSPVISSVGATAGAALATTAMVVGGMLTSSPVEPPGELALTPPPTSLVTTEVVPSPTSDTSTTTASTTTTPTAATIATTPAPSSTAATTAATTPATTPATVGFLPSLPVPLPTLPPPTVDPFAGPGPVARDIIVRLEPGTTTVANLLARTTSGPVEFSLLTIPSRSTISLSQADAQAVPGPAVLVGVATTITASTTPGTDRVSYRVCDAAGRCDDGTLVVLIAAISTPTTPPSPTITTTSPTTTTAGPTTTSLPAAMIPPAANIAPVITILGDLVVIGAQDGTAPVSAVDADGDPLSVSATGLPAGLEIAIEGVGMTLRWDAAHTSPEASDIGIRRTVTVTVSDGRGGSATGAFELTILEASPLRGSLRINEVNFKAGTTEDEFVELMNLSSSAIDYREIRLRDYAPSGTSDADSGGYSISGGFEYSPSDYKVDPGQAIVAWLRPFDEPAGLPPLEQNPSAINRYYTGYIGGNGALSEAGDDLWLLDGEGRVIDYVAWGVGSEIGATLNAPSSLWDPGHQLLLAAVGTGQSISLAADTTTGESGCWEPTGSGLAAGRCSVATFPTLDTDTVMHGGADQRTTSSGRSNH